MKLITPKVQRDAKDFYHPNSVAIPSLNSVRPQNETDFNIMQDMIMTAEDPNAAMAARMAAAASSSSVIAGAEPSSPCSSGGGSSSTSGVGGSGTDVYRLELSARLREMDFKIALFWIKSAT